MANHNEEDVRVIMVPLPEHGHLNQLLHLSRLVSAHAIPVHYVGNTTHTSRAKLRVHGWNPSSAANVHFHEFPTTPSPFPLKTYINAASELRPHVAELIRELGSTARRVVVIHDSLMTSAVQDVVSVPNAESYNFQSISAFAVLGFAVSNLAIGDEVLPAVLDGCVSSAYTDFIASHYAHRDFNSGNLYNTSRIIEAPYIDRLSKEMIWGSKLQWPIGPFNPLVAIDEYSKPRHRCLEWLDTNKDRNSVILVSFGTTTTFSEEQIKEIALGLEQSNQKFIWVLRDKDKHDNLGAEEEKSNELLPEGYEERVREMGMVVRDWAPQLEILGHPSTGGFMSHCGWNSCIESISMGVPIAAWPMHSDQPLNAFLVTKLLKIGIVAKDWGKKDELVKSETVEKVVRNLMGSVEGAEIRERVAELGVALRRSVEEGGGSPMELESFIAHITR